MREAIAVIYVLACAVVAIGGAWGFATALRVREPRLLLPGFALALTGALLIVRVFAS